MIDDVKHSGKIMLLLALLAMLSACVNSTGLPSDSARSPQEFSDCKDCLPMIALPAGDLLIGSPANEAGRDRPRAIEESPQRHLAIGAFAIGKYPVRRGDWAAFVAATNREVRGHCSWSALPGTRRDGANPDASWKNLGFEQTDDHPAVCISWFDAQDYVHWLSKKTGKRYRLPSEAEWEYAARAGTDSPYPWGVEARRDRANYGADRCCSGLAEGADRWVYTSPVGSFPANAFGLHDMHGNAMQWVQDCLAYSYADRVATGAADEKDVPLRMLGDFDGLTGQSSCAYRILRGGNWGDTPQMIRSAARNFGPPPDAKLEGYSSAGGGFRVARSLE